MQDVTEVKIIGIDKNRPPLIRDAPYIDLVFELSEQTTQQWNNDFFSLFKNARTKPSIDAEESQFILTWVRKMEDIPALFVLLKAKVLECNQIAKDRQTALDLLTQAGGNTSATISEPQRQLNEIIAQLDFD